MNLYKCDLTIYVLAESQEEAQIVAVNNADQEHFTNWEVEKVTEKVPGLWGVSLPYVDYDVEELTCNQWLERNQNVS